jgi:hypothetical protein
MLLWISLISAILYGKQQDVNYWFNLAFKITHINCQILTFLAASIEVGSIETAKNSKFRRPLQILAFIVFIMFLSLFFISSLF